MKGSDFVFDCVHLLNLYLVGSYIDSPDCLKNKKETINPINKIDNKYLQYARALALNHEKIRKNPEIINTISIKFFTDKYNWEGINYPPEKNDRK